MDGLSNNAVRLLNVLRREEATAPARALTDSELAQLTFLPHRAIIDAAGELLAAGYLVLAGPRGRWLGQLAEAMRYAHSLRVRAARIFKRRQAVLAGIERHRRMQLTLPGIAP